MRQALFDHPFFCGLSPGHRHFLLEQAEPREFAKGEEIFGQGERLGRVFFLRTGRVKIVETDAHGKQVILDIACPGDVIGIASVLTDVPSWTSAQCLETARGWSLPRHAVMAFLDESHWFVQHVLQWLSTFACRASKRILSCHTHSVMERVAESLLRLNEIYSNNHSGKARPAFRVRREDLAAFAGTTLESSVRCLSELRRRGVVELEGRRVRIKDPRALAIVMEG